MEVEIREGFVDPFAGHLHLDNRLVLAKLQVVLNTGQGHLARQELAELLLRLYHVIGTDLFEYPHVQRSGRSREDQWHPEIFEEEGHEHAGLDVFPDYDRRPVELLKPEVAQD